MEKIDIENEIIQYLENTQLKGVEKDAIQVLNQLLYLFLSVNDKKHQCDQNKTIEEYFLENKLNLIEFLKNKGYIPKPFQILKVDTFNEHLEYLKILMNNLCYYLDKYQYEYGKMNIYYYIFHLIYFILSIIIKSKDKILLSDDIIKFYFYHIVHFFKNEEKTIEGHYFFYHGAFKILKKKYSIQTKFVIEFNDNLIPFQISYNIMKILRKLGNDLSSSKNQDELDFLGKVSQFLETSNKITSNFDDIYEKLPPNDNGKFIELFEHISNGIKEIKEILDKNKIKCDKLEQYKSKVDKFKDLISLNNMTKNDLILMELNIRKIPEKDFKPFEHHIERYINLAEFYNECDKDSNKDYTETFKNILNSEKFKDLYYKAMDSSHIKNFVNKFKLNDLYEEFMKKYAKNINDYILYVPLTRGIKAYVSNYFRIALNINSIELLGELDENSKNDILISYLLIQLLQESFHFLFRLNKEGNNLGEGLSPNTKKIKESYEEIGVDLILNIFGTEYITYISKKNGSLISDINAWANSTTDFKVFNKVYLSKYRLINDNDKENEMNSGLRCYITLGYEYSDIQNFKICSDDTIKYCF